MTWCLMGMTQKAQREAKMKGKAQQEKNVALLTSELATCPFFFQSLLLSFFCKKSAFSVKYFCSLSYYRYYNITNVRKWPKMPYEGTEIAILKMTWSLKLNCVCL